MLTRLPLFAATLALCTSLSGVVQAEEDGFEITGDAAAGEKVFKKCKACHAVGEGAESKVGPPLNGILGKTAATTEGFKYSKALIEKAEAEGLTWTPETLDAFLLKPKDYVEGTKMSFAGLRKEDQRANVIAYLATFTD